MGSSPNYAKALYVDPPSHDFCTWLRLAEMNRRFHKCDEPLRVRFLLQDGMLGKFDYGPFGILDGRSYECGYNAEYSATMIENVLRPAITMIGGVNEPDLNAPIRHEEVANYCEYNYHFWQLVDAAKLGHEVPRWNVPKEATDLVKGALKGERPIVITLRETPIQPERNSRTDEWLKFADYVKDRHRVIFVRDTCQVKNPTLPFPDGTESCPPASTNAFVRAALYQEAFCNMAVGNGPNAWFIYSGAPYLIFKQLTPELVGWEQGTREGWRQKCHLDIGDQFPWAQPNQRLTWKDDTFENVMSEFDAFVSRTIRGAA